MKWKIAGPDDKRRESPKYKQQHQQQFNDYYSPSMTSNKFAYPSHNHSKFSSYSDYSNEPIDIVARRFQEMERHEREMERIRELERMQSFNNYGNHRHQFEHQFRSTSFEFDNTQSYRSNYDVKPVRNNFFYGERENYVNNYHQQQQPPQNKRIWIQDDEEEDELYFYGGGRKKRESKVEREEEVYIEPQNDTYDLESSSIVSDNPSSSWSTDSESESEVEVVAKNHQTSVKPKAYAPKVIDLDAPTITKLPPNPIPSTWAHIVHNPLKAIQKQLPSTTEILTKSIASRNWLQGLKLRNPVQGILMRPPFNEETFTIKHWIKFMQKLLPTVMQDGYLFIWIEREELADVIRAADQYLSFRYVENLCWIRRDVGNRLVRETGTLFYKSKMTMLILRRDPNNRCKLRHQRNPDCIFDFIGPGRMPDGRVYDVIETLLDGSKSPGPHLMHLWAGNSPTDRLVYQARKHWIRVLEVDEVEDVETQDLVTENLKENVSESITGNSKESITESVREDVKEVVSVIEEVKVLTEIEQVVTEEAKNQIDETVVIEEDSVHNQVKSKVVEQPATNNIEKSVTEDDETIIPLTPPLTIETENVPLTAVAAIEDDLETELPEPSEAAEHKNDDELIDDHPTCDPGLETIVNATLKDLSQPECKIPSSTFDEDFCNFITCDPLSNC